MDSTFLPGKQRKNQIWVASYGERPFIARRNKTVSKTMYAIFFDEHGPVLQVPVLKGSLVTGQFYKEQILGKLVKVYTERTMIENGLDIDHLRLV